MYAVRAGLREDEHVRPNEEDARTYQDLMDLLPEVAKITVWWTRDEDGIPRFADRVTLRGHNGEALIEATSEDVEKLPGFVQRAPADEHPLPERLPAVFAILTWADAFALDEDPDGASIIELPSSSHLGSALPRDFVSE